METGGSSFCPGNCGRVLINATHQPSLYGECGPCPWGSRNVDSSRCEECTLPLRFYDFLFLIFHAVLPLFINGIFIKVYATSDQRNRSKTLPTRWLVAQLVCAAVEATLGLVSAILIFSAGTHLPFVSYAFELAGLIVFRSVLYAVAARFGRRLPAGPFYAALWTLPIMALVHSFMGGFIYVTFANLTVFSALLSNAIHLALEGHKGVLELFKQIFTHVETMTLVLVHLFLFGYGILALYFNPPPTDWTSWLVLLVILPSPVLFYVLTVRLTEPVRVRNRR
ncbi:hypothetical protein M3Y99_01876800 [Aphelenchoides fujianensis]|nr:hypothetical protein M3Y99_01876800 [Aphelenchoides fujianensis]